MTVTEPAPTPRFARADGPDKVTGTGRYTADLTLTGVLIRGTVSDLPSLAASAGVEPPALTVIGAVVGLDLR